MQQLKEEKLNYILEKMNKYILTGNIGKDAEVKDLNNGNSVINFSVAHTEKWKDKQGNPQEKTVWVDCSWFINNTSIAQYLKKGTKVLIEGEPTARAYVNNNGEAVAILGCTVRSLEITQFANNDNPQPQQPQQPQQPMQQAQQEEEPDLLF